MDELADLLDQKASEEPWLAEVCEPLLAEWREAYLASMDSAEHLRADVDRAIASLESTLPKAKAALLEEAEAIQALESYEARTADKVVPSLAERQHQSTLSEKLATTRKATINAINAVIDGIKPDPTGIQATADSKPDSPETTPQEATTESSQQLIPDSSDPQPESDSDSDSSVSACEHTGDESDLSTTDSDNSSGLPGRTEPEAESTEDSTVPVDTTVSAKTVTPDTVEPQEEDRDTTADDLPKVQEAIWRAVGNDQLGLAYHIARLDQGNQGSNPPNLRPSFLLLRD